jgi:hypothetical protein
VLCSLGRLFPSRCTHADIEYFPCVFLSSPTLDFKSSKAILILRHSFATCDMLLPLLQVLVETPNSWRPAQFYNAYTPVCKGGLQEYSVNITGARMGRIAECRSSSESSWAARELQLGTKTQYRMH